MKNDRCDTGLPKIELFTDGACSGNPGPGGWGVLMRCGAEEKELCGGAATTTNNQMELQAVIEGFRALKRPCHVTVYTDSQYVHRGMTEWVTQWQKNKWRTASKQPVKNQQLWEELVAIAASHQTQWVWVRGHSGHPENERADALARQGIFQR